MVKTRGKILSKRRPKKKGLPADLAQEASQGSKEAFNSYLAASEDSEMEAMVSGTMLKDIIENWDIIA